MTVPTAQYLRMSTEHQQYSLQNQAEVIRDYAERHGFEVVKSYSDTGRSGLQLRNRPEMKRLLNDVISGDAEFKAVLVYDVSRWGRFQDCDEAAHYEFICKSAGVPVHYCAENFSNDNTVPSSIFKALKRTMAAEYSREMGVRCFAGARRLAELGFKQGGAAGYGLHRLMISADGQRIRILSHGERKALRTDRVILVPGPEEEVACVREMYRLLVEEKRTASEITRELNRRGLTQRGRKWSHQLVYRILTDPKYAGCNVWNRSSKRLGQRYVTIPRSQWLLKENAFEPVVDPELFEKAQRILAEQKLPYSDEELLKSLRQLLVAKGKLSYELFTATPNLASAHTFVRRFGSLRRAFELAGHTYPWRAISRRYAGTIERMQNRLLEQILLLFPNEVSIRQRNPGEYIQLDESLNVNIVVCPATRKRGCIAWVADACYSDRANVILLARLTSDNKMFKDFHILPALGRHWISGRGQLKNGRQLLDLSDFCSAVRAVACLP